jgi:hypothetical protein
LAVRNLVDRWAHCAGRRKPDRRAALFTADGTVKVHMDDPASSEPVQSVKGHAQLAEAITVLNAYDAATHFIGQSIVTLDRARAPGETYCLAHHPWVESGWRTLLVISIRCLDTFVRQAGRWPCAERLLVTDWTDKQPSERGALRPAQS